MLAKPNPLTALLAEIRACRLCAAHLPHGPRPVLRAGPGARLAVCSQAPGLKVHETGLPFNDRSGDRLRDWMGVSRDEFYDLARVSIIPMGFCFPGYDSSGADLPPRAECVHTWHGRLFALTPPFDLLLLIGGYAQRYHLGARVKAGVTETVLAWRDYAPRYLPLPHPSWRNNGWLKKNPWFETELLPFLQSRVRRILSVAS